ncbi:MAG: hypothetical protein ACYSYL_00145 [Planctomycetota bacterium]|jgi:hypothetical protein
MTTTDLTYRNPTPTHIESLLGDTLHEIITDWCITNVSTEDLSRADHVVLGKPTSELRDNIVVSVHTQHPLGPEKDTDQRVEGKPRTWEERPWQFPRESHGGARFQMMYGAIQIRMRERNRHRVALAHKSVVAHRIRRAIERDTRLRVLEDDLGNTMLMIETFRHSGHAAGGGNVTVFIEWIDWRALIVSDNRRNVTL